MAHASVVVDVGAPPAPEAVGVPPPPLVLEHPHTSTGLDSRKLLMWAFLASDCMFFGTLIATYMVYKNRSVDGPLPHEGADGRVAHGEGPARPRAVHAAVLRDHVRGDEAREARTVRRPERPGA